MSGLDVRILKNSLAVVGLGQRAVDQMRRRIVRKHRSVDAVFIRHVYSQREFAELFLRTLTRQVLTRQPFRLCPEQIEVDVKAGLGLPASDLLQRLSNDPDFKLLAVTGEELDVSVVRNKF